MIRINLSTPALLQRLRVRRCKERKKYPLNYPESRMYYRYGITIAEKNSIFEKQGKVCAICKSPDPKSKVGWHTDHDHATNVVRGILCHACNTALGQMQENIEVLQSMIAYLQNHAVEQRAPDKEAT
jgi:hypothetical protein